MDALDVWDFVVNGKTVSVCLVEEIDGLFFPFTTMARIKFVRDPDRSTTDFVMFKVTPDPVVRVLGEISSNGCMAALYLYDELIFVFPEGPSPLVFPLGELVTLSDLRISFS